MCVLADIFLRTFTYSARVYKMNIDYSICSENFTFCRYRHFVVDIEYIEIVITD